jgi:MFS family permease
LENNQDNLINRTSSHIKNILHGFFLSVGTTVAEPLTVLPMIIAYFSGNPFLVGLYTSLLKGGAILVQMVSAFYAQSYPKMMPYMRIVFFFRFISWFSIGLIIYFFGEINSTLTLWGIGIGLFIFSFSSGFGAIYFKEIQAKIFSHDFRGKTMAYRQFFSNFGAIISGTATGFILESFEPPYSFAYLFLISAFIMGLGLIAFGSIEEPIKNKIQQKEKSFRKFLKNSFSYLKHDKQLNYQVYGYLLSYSYLFAVPFVILDAKENIEITGTILGILITSQMTGAMLSNIIWGKLSFNRKNREIIYISTFLVILSLILVILFKNIYIYGLVFFIFGASMDGFRLSFGNLILIIAPEEKRPVYVALSATISSIGLFFPIIGGILLKHIDYNNLYLFTILVLTLGLFFSAKIKE